MQARMPCSSKRAYVLQESWLGDSMLTVSGMQVKEPRTFRGKVDAGDLAMLRKHMPQLLRLLRGRNACQ